MLVLGIVNWFAYARKHYHGPRLELWDFCFSVIQRSIGSIRIVSSLCSSFLYISIRLVSPSLLPQYSQNQLATSETETLCYKLFPLVALLRYGQLIGVYLATTGCIYFVAMSRHFYHVNSGNRGLLEPTKYTKWLLSHVRAAALLTIVSASGRSAVHSDSDHEITCDRAWASFPSRLHEVVFGVLY